MDTEKKSPDQPKGKTVFQKYSRWKKGQHMTTVLQMVPGQEKKILIGRIYFERNGEEKTYVAEGVDGKVLGVSKSYVDIEKRFAEHGDQLAAEEISKKNLRQEITPEPEQKPVPPTEKTPVQEQESPEAELDELRKRNKSNDKGMTR